MITSAQVRDPCHPASPRMRRGTKQHRDNRDFVAPRDVMRRYSSTSLSDAPTTPCLSFISSPSSSGSIIWTDTFRSRSGSDSSETSDTQHETCMIADKSVTVLPKRSLTKSHVATKRRKTTAKSKSPAKCPKRSRSLSHYPPEITSALDPFLTTPVELSHEDRVLLHWYLSVGRRVILGTSEKPKHDLSLDMASRQIQRCPIHMLACISISEYIICVKNQMSRPPRLYQRIGRAYALVKDILFQSDSSLQERVSALLNLQMMESALDQKATQVVHLQALDHMVAQEGGYQAVLTKMNDGNPMIAPVDLLGQCLWSMGFQRDQRLAFETAKSCLLESLAHIRSWVDKNSRTATSISASGSQITTSMEYNDTDGLGPLKRYLCNGINSHLRRPKVGSLAHAPAMFNLLFSIPFTFAWLDCSPQIATELLLELQQCMQTSVADDAVLPGSVSNDETDNLRVLHPNQAFSSFYHIRSRLTNSHPVYSDQDPLYTDGESYLCSMSIDIAKLFSVMPESMRIQLGTDLLQCIFYSSSDIRDTCFDREELGFLDDELETIWNALP